VGAAHAEILLDLAGCLQTTGAGGAVSGGDEASCGEALVCVGCGDGLRWGGYSATKRLRAGLGGGSFGDEEGWRHWVGLTSEVAGLAVRFNASRARFAWGVRVL
jgi:hypothetical protein